MEKTLKAPKIKIEKNIPLPKYTKMAQEDSLVDDLKKMNPLESRMINIEYNEKNLNAQRTRIYELKNKHNLEDRQFTVNKDPMNPGKLRV